MPDPREIKTFSHEASSIRFLLRRGEPGTQYSRAIAPERIGTATLLD
jgi:hypothetical protein